MPARPQGCDQDRLSERVASVQREANIPWTCRYLDQRQRTADSYVPELFWQNWQSEGRIHHQDRPKHCPCTAGKGQGTNWEHRSHLCSPGQHDRRWHPRATDRTDSMVNSATYPVKPMGEVRPCVDCMPLNKAIIRENHTQPTVEEIAHKLARARYFTKGDAYKAFLHMHLSKKNRELTVFGTNTHGRLWYKRMPFGMKMSQDMFQIQMDCILEQCPGVIGIHDDVIIYGYTREDHDANLINFLNVCQMEGLCLSSKKLELRRDRVSFFGAIYSREVVKPDPKKIQGIEEMTAPETKQQLQSFLGMVTYMGNFIPHLSHHTELLRQLLKKDVTFYSVLSGNQTPFKESNIKATWILRSEKSSDCPGRCLSQGTGCLSHTGWQTNSLCQQVTDRSGEPLCQHRKRTAHHCLCMHTVQHLLARGAGSQFSQTISLWKWYIWRACTTRLHVFRGCSYSYRNMTWKSNTNQAVKCCWQTLSRDALPGTAKRSNSTCVWTT